MEAQKIIPAHTAVQNVVRSFVCYCGQGSSLLWTPAVRPLC